MTTFVLVHGAWGGSYGFRAVRRILQAEGHEVTTPSLTGIGERVHLAGPLVGLRAHVHDVVNHVLYEDLNDIVLLGYSYGGMVITGCLDHIGDRIGDLVYLDAFVPADGQSAADLIGLPGPDIELGMASALPAAAREFASPADTEWNNARRVPQPVATLTERVSVAVPLEQQPFGLTFIRATESDPSDVGEAAFTAAAAHARDSDRWTYHEVATNHMIPANRPDELAAILSGI